MLSSILQSSGMLERWQQAIPVADSRGHAPSGQERRIESNHSAAKGVCDSRLQKLFQKKAVSYGAR